MKEYQLKQENILYEDNQIIVVFKEKGILSQEDITKDNDLLSLVKEYIKIKYNKPGNVYLGLVHRLDRNTSGIMVFARTSKAASRLNEQIKNGMFCKKYEAIVDGIIDKEGYLENYLRKDEKEVKSYVTNNKNDKLAKLSYKPIKVLDNKTLLDITLYTGRHHQIRVQLSNIGHPLSGDTLYGSKYNDIGYYLNAYYLSFEHPVSKEKLEFIKKLDY